MKKKSCQFKLIPGGYGLNQIFLANDNLSTPVAPFKSSWDA